MQLLGVNEKRITVAWEAAGTMFSPRKAEDIRRVLDHYGIRQPYFLSVGALSARKNLPRLLRAWRRVLPRVDAMLVIAGKSGFRFSDGAGLGELPGRVIHLSSVSDDELACLYSGAQGLLYPSLYEGFGLPMLEAMACGCPVLASDCTAMPEIAGDAAILVDPLSEAAIAGGILDLSRPAKRDDLRAKGFLRHALFSWDRTAAIAERAILS